MTASPTRARIVLAAGGTGGHMFPAEALAGELIDRGLMVDLITDQRGQGFGDRIRQVAVHRISAGALAGGLVRRAQSVAQLGVGFFQARALLYRLAPAVAVGFGGYASVPTMLAASFAGIPTIVHEQNAILGRANRMLARRVTRIAASFASMNGRLSGRAVVVTGNPVRSAIAAVGDTPYIAPAGQDEFHLLITGGSQGARVFSRLIPSAVALLPAELRQRLAIVQQCRAEDIDQARAFYQPLNMTVDLSPFFADMPERLRLAQIVICRSGASTVAELTAAGRPAILIPYPHATDDHQTANAKAVEMAGAAWLMPEASTTPALLAARLAELMGDPARLDRAAACAHSIGRRDAAMRLADLVHSLVRGNGRHQPNDRQDQEAA